LTTQNIELKEDANAPQRAVPFVEKEIQRVVGLVGEINRDVQETKTVLTTVHKEALGFLSNDLTRLLRTRAEGTPVPTLLPQPPHTLFGEVEAAAGKVVGELDSLESVVIHAGLQRAGFSESEGQVTLEQAAQGALDVLAALTRH